MPDLLIEIGTEEIPASYIEPALEGIDRVLRERCAERRLTLPGATLLGTPRRLVIHCAGVPDSAESVVEVRRGPPESAAYDADGNPTKAAEGFARGQGTTVDELEVLETPKGRYLAARISLTGAPAGEVVAEALPRALAAAPFPKVMRWTGSAIPFARPVRNLLVVLGDEPVPVRAAGVTAGRRTSGHRFLAPEPIELPSADLQGYVETMRGARVVVDPSERRRLIHEGLAARIGEKRASAAHPGLLEEVTYLTEWPVVIEGRIDREFLELPVEVLEVAMRVHLRFFPVFDASGLPEARFLSVMDREECSADTVRDGNETVLRSRLFDALFFLGEDRKRTLEDRLPDLEDKAVHRGLGSYRAKAARLEELAGWLAVESGNAEHEAAARRAGRLAKADLVTEMVGEFPELQGTVGRVYAARDGEAPEVAEAVEDHYRPRGPGDGLPRGPVACVVSLAEKIDDLATFLTVVGAPSGSSDPFGLRRQAIGLIRTATERGIPFALDRALRRSAELFGSEDIEASVETALEFIGERLYRHCREAGHRYDLIRAAMAPGFADLVDFQTRLKALGELREEAGWNDLVEVAERTTNILKGGEIPADVADDRLVEPEERELLAALVRGEPEVEEHLSRGDYVGAARAFVTAFAEPVHEFFAKVYVNVEDEGLRRNRLALVGRVNRLIAERFADLSGVERAQDE